MPPAKRTRKKRKKKLKQGTISVIVLIAAGIIALLLYKYMEDNYIRYGNPGILVPDKYSFHGIDVSHHNGNINWKGVQQMSYEDISVRFIFMKATQGANFIDARFSNNWRNAKKAGIPRGAYHYFIPSVKIEDQIRNFRTTVRLSKGDLPPVLDVEQTDGLPMDELKKRVIKWLNAAEKVYGVKPILYTYATFYRDYLSPELDEYPLWVAHYALRTDPNINRNWHFWQLSDRSNIDGISTFTDFNVFNGDSVAFNKLIIK